MTTLVNTYVLDAALNSIAGASPLKLCVTQTEPLTLADCTSQSGSGGKRVTTESTITGEVVLSDGANAISRKMTIPAKTFTDGVTVAVDGGSADLWLAVYDSSRLLLRSSNVTNQALTVGATLTTPSFDFGISQV